MGAKFISEKIRQKSMARLAAVQAMYMVEFGEFPVEKVIKAFSKGEVGRFAIEETTNGVETVEEFVPVMEMDAAYFGWLTRGVHKKKEELECSLDQYLKDGFPFERFDETLKAILLCALFELNYTEGVDATVIVKEYVDLAYAFYTKGEPKMVNALLDHIARTLRRGFVSRGL